MCLAKKNIFLAFNCIGGAKSLQWWMAVSGSNVEYNL